MKTNTQPIECPKCGGEVFLHLQSPVWFYRCAEQRCTYQIDARLVRTIPTTFELQQEEQLTQHAIG